MICLGIESTAHTFGIGIVDDQGNVLANEKRLFTTEEGGMIPRDVADHHVDCCEEVLKAALEKAGISLRKVDIIAYSRSPGLGNTLKIGALVTRTLAKRFGLPIVPVNHCIAHLEIGKARTGAKDPVLLYCSGANTQVIAYEGERYRIFGETLDMGVGNMIDQFARELGLGFPGGPKVELLAKDGKDYIELPYVVKGMDVTFGGMFTHLRIKIRSGHYSKEDLCYSMQETVFAELVEVAERAMAHCGKKELVLGGGVACNKRLQEMCRQMCEARGAKSYVPENQFLVDNGAMIAWNGILSYQKGRFLSFEDADIDPYERTDDIDA